MKSKLQVFFESLKVEGNVQPVGESAISECETELGITLPANYKNFCRVFGGGRLFRLFTFGVPCGHPDCFDLTKKHGFWRNVMLPEEINEYCPQPEIFWRSVFFADDIRTDYYAWDIEDVTSQQSSEYVIYRVRRDFTLDRLAETFEEFVINTCVADAHELEEDDPPNDAMVFQPQI